MTVKAIVDAYRAVGGFSGIAVFGDGQVLYSDNIESDYALSLLDLLRSSAGARRVSVAVRGFTFTVFSLEGYGILLKLPGRFPGPPSIHLPEPEYVDTSGVPGLPPISTARAEVEAALRAFGIAGR